VPLGVLAALKRGSFLDQAVRLVSIVGYSVPVFILGLMSLLVFYAKLGWVEGPGRMNVTYLYSFPEITGMLLIDTALDGQWDAFRNALAHIVLPASALGLFSASYISRMTRAFMLNELAQDYVITARVKGVSEARVIWGHAFRNAAVPLVTVIALSYAALLEGSVLTETVFAWPGIGQYITNSISNADLNAVLGATLVIGAVFVVLHLITDLLCRLLDPRAR
jgi:peptide/nickel transport system permease protein